MYQSWLDTSNKGEFRGIVLLDLSAAFDLVCPKLLHGEKCMIYRVSNDFLQLLESYLIGRKQAVCQDNILWYTMAVFKIRMSGEPAALAGIFRNESRTGRITLLSKNTSCSRWVCLQSNKQLEYPSSRHQNNRFIIDFQN